MHEIPNFPFTSPQEPSQSVLARQELGHAADIKATTPAEDSQQALSED